MKKILFPYLLLLFLLLLFSYGFVDANFPFKTWPFLYNLIHFQRGPAAAIYILIVSLLFGFYAWVLWQIKENRLTAKEVWKLIGITTAILFFSFPAFSYDIFNYLATARMTFFYKENPYIVMPIEIPNEPMLEFVHGSNKTALYGPFWILLTAIPHFAGLGRLFFTVFTFKALISLFYLGLVWLIWKLSRRSVWSLAFFGLNPLVVIETLVSAHNDAVMMFFALLSFYLLKRKKLWLALFSLVCSILIKFATIFLLPVFLYAFWQKIKKQKIVWQRIWQYSVCGLLIIFSLSPLREELYSWYLIWPLAFVSLLPQLSNTAIVLSAFSFGLMFRITPFLYTRNWGGATPLIKKIVTLLPPCVAIGAIWQRKRLA